MAAHRTQRKLFRVLEGLSERYGPLSPPTRDAFELVVWEKVAYLASDDRRGAAFDQMRNTIGTSPTRVLAAKRSAVVHALELGGIAAADRAEHLIAAAELVVGEFDGSLESVCARPLPEAKRALKKIYGIGDPGAEKILLFTGHHAVMGLDSNALRVLVRLGYGVESKSYGATYKSATTAAVAELGADIGRLMEANLLLRRHGQVVCKTSSPRCGACAVNTLCPSANRGAITESLPRAPKPRPIRPSRPH